MQAGEYQPTVQLRPPPPLFQSPTEVTSDTSPSVSPLDTLELEALMLNLDASLRVHARHHLFTWTQGLLQNLVKHELLICALRSAERMSFHVDSFATSLPEPGHLSDMFRQDASVVPHLIKTWQDNYFQPVICETGEASPLARSTFARELNGLGANNLLAHGTYDISGEVVSFFTFACKAGTIGPRQVYFAELIVPYLHLAWVRSQTNRRSESADANPAGAGLLTSREREIMKWIHMGKSNIEIGAILEISPLTVKNHVQKILRKLNVQNRAQAVGKALALRILSI